MINKAKLLAQFVHEGQTRYNGEPCFNHCDRVASDFEGDFKCIAYLHDSLEDSTMPCIIHHIIEETFTHKISESINILTHRKHFVSYNHYLYNISQYPFLMDIKWSDMIDNTTDTIPEKQKQKYHDACYYLQSCGIAIPKILEDRLYL